MLNDKIIKAFKELPMYYLRNVDIGVFTCLEETEWVELYKLSCIKKADHLLARIVIDNNIEVTDKLKSVLTRAINVITLRFMKMEEDIKLLSDILSSSYLPFMFIKGSEIRHLYKEPYMRVSNDIDLIVKRELFDTAIEVLKNHNFIYDKTSGCHASFTSPHNVHIELHFELFNEQLPCLHHRLDNIFDIVHEDKDIPCRYHMDDMTYYLYHLGHMSKHLVSGEWWVPPFVDTYLLRKNLKEDPTSLLESVGLSKLDIEVNNMINTWYTKDEPSEVTRLFESYIFSDEFENSIAFQRKDNKSTFGYVLSRLFLPRKVLGSVYPIILKHPILTPIYQVKRWMKIIFKKTAMTPSEEIKASNNLSKQRIKDTKQLFTSLGLDNINKK